MAAASEGESQERGGGRTEGVEASPCAGTGRTLSLQREQEVEESVAAFKQSREELKKELEDFAAPRSIAE